MTNTGDSFPAEKRDKDIGPSQDDGDSDDDVFHDARFPAEEEAQLLKEAHEIKTEANQLYSSGCYDQAISCYDRALASCPNYLDYDVAVLRCNISACYLKMEDWKSAVDTATMSLDRLEKIIPSEPPKADQSDAQSSKPTISDTHDSDAVVEISGDDDEAEEKELKRLQELDETRTNVLRIRAKALMRRAKGEITSVRLGQLTSGMDNLPAGDRRIVQKALRELPSRLNEAKEKEMGEMMSKMKDLGNGFLKPFGLSTDNFKFVQDPKTGGYSMNFES
ncbi:tetratricopeptide repeat protein 1 (TTC1) [Penicillium verhagenii]|nr:tetratricopeptide repeat protein 1 (TTC1) [Penicillium verhagenii]